MLTDCIPFKFFYKIEQKEQAQRFHKETDFKLLITTLLPSAIGNWTCGIMWNCERKVEIRIVVLDQVKLPDWENVGLFGRTKRIRIEVIILSV